MFEGVPNHPRPDRFWEIVEKYRVSIFYTAPTALRALMKEGNHWPAHHDLSSLRLLGSVGEPINPKAWMWYRETIGQGRCPIVDTWWQTENGGIVISPIPGVYTTGIGAKTDEDGYFWIMGRIDDVINVSGHRLGTAELECVLVSHGSIAEAAVAGMPHETKGQGIYAFVTVKTEVLQREDLIAALKQQVRSTIGPIATPDRVQFAEVLPKTRSGKTMRRLLAKIAAGDMTNLGDTTTLTDEAVLDDLIRNRQ